MVSIDKCKKLLNSGKRKYSEEEIKAIREFLYLIAEFENNDLNKDDDECNNLLQSELR